MAGFLEKLRLVGRSAEQDYSEVDLGQFEELEEEDAVHPGNNEFEGDVK